jgi:hypothetical protein
MKYNLQVLPSSIINKSLKVKQAFLSSYESAQSRGLTEEECLFAGTQSALAIDKASKPALERVKPAIPMHLAAVLNKQLVEPSITLDKPLSIKQEFLGKNAITPDNERSLVSASWDNQARLRLQFDDGKTIVTDPVPVSEYIEQHVAITNNNSNGNSTIVEGEEIVYSKRVDVVSDLIIYKGEAPVGSPESTATWRIRKLDISIEGDVKETWATGNANFDKLWTDRLTYIYS